ncbi:hypothetical protein HRI_005110100 [Hibiscus trionum]|uniref:Uncharacterized protein n=2 Tax=Hibiscus trionum TaxID=183268 RepID=A0A9W7MTA2_HIBTR|nr:hypothetical protein HRI_005110100 [Hibiscus trionum]
MTLNNMTKRRRLNIVSTIRNSESHSEGEEQQATPAQHPEQSQEQQSQQSEDVRGVGGEPSQLSSQNTNRKKVRGATLMPDIWELPEGQRVNVKFNNLYQPVGEESTCLGRFIGTMVRKAEFAPISRLNWHEMPNSKKEEMWSTIELKFQFQLFDSEEVIDEATLKRVKKWVLSYMNTKWRQCKNELKSQIFDENQTVEQMVRNCKDSRVNKEQLKTLVEYWLSSKSMEQSATNRLNRSKLDEPHCTGTRSFPRIFEDMTAESSGIPPSRADVYVRTRTRKNGSIVNSAAAVVVERIQEKINEGTSSGNLSQATSWSNDVFAQVKGPERKWRVRCVGAVQTRPSQESGPSQPVQNTEEVEGLKAKLAAFEKLLETCLLPIYRQQRPDLHVPDMNALLQIVDTQAAPDAGSATAAVNSRSMPSENQHNIDDPSTQ